MSAVGESSVVNIRALWLSALVLSCLDAPAQARELELYLIDAPPLTFVEDPQGHGLVGDVAIAAIERAGYQAKLSVLPWARAQRYVSLGSDLLIIPLSRIPEREDQYTWIAPILTMDRAFFSLEHKVDTFDEAKRRFRKIGVGLGSAQEATLLSEGFPPSQIYSMKIGENPPHMLDLGRIDAWFNGVPESLYIWKNTGIPRRLQMGKAVTSSDLYVACSKKCDPELVRQLREAMEAIQADGTAQRLQDAYQLQLPKH
ncbi:amino acid ABC transporter substrate-binding protein [Pseudomonas indica]|nr:amino acid ABC transporter substrate-binding protein [Pseudomonas indica]